MNLIRLVCAGLCALPVLGAMHTPGQECPPTERGPAASAEKLKPARLAGRYNLTLISLWPLREDSIAAGLLELWIDTVTPPPPPPASSQPESIPPPLYPRPTLIGATDAPTWRLKAFSRVRPDSREPNAPGFRLIDTVLVLGACPDQEYCEDRHSTDFVITAVNKWGFRGFWALRPSSYPPVGVDSAGWPSGYFCAARLK